MSNQKFVFLHLLFVPFDQLIPLGIFRIPVDERLVGKTFADGPMKPRGSENNQRVAQKALDDFGQVCTKKNGLIYRGSFDKDDFNGHGELVISKDKKYVGDFVDYAEDDDEDGNCLDAAFHGDFDDSEASYRIHLVFM